MYWNHLPIVFLFCFFFLVVVVFFAWVKCRKIFPIDWRVVIFFRISVETKKEYWGICTKKQTSGDYHKESEKLSSTTRKRKSAEKRGKWQLKIETNINSIYPSRGQKKIGGRHVAFFRHYHNSIVIIFLFVCYLFSSYFLDGGRITMKNNFGFEGFFFWKLLLLPGPPHFAAVGQIRRGVEVAADGIFGVIARCRVGVGQRGAADGAQRGGALVVESRRCGRRVR